MSEYRMISVELIERTICRLTHGHEHDKAVCELHALLSEQPQASEVGLIDKFAAEHPEEWDHAVKHTEAQDKLYAARDAVVAVGDEPRCLELLDSAIFAFENLPADSWQPSAAQSAPAGEREAFEQRWAMRAADDEGNPGAKPLRSEVEPLRYRGSGFMGVVPARRRLAAHAGCGGSGGVARSASQSTQICRGLG